MHLFDVRTETANDSKKKKGKRKKKQMKIGIVVYSEI